MFGCYNPWARIRTLKAALRLIEWSWLVDESDDPNEPNVVEHCPYCGISRRAGHGQNCPVAAALGAD